MYFHFVWWRILSTLLYVRIYTQYNTIQYNTCVLLFISINAIKCDAWWVIRGGVHQVYTKASTDGKNRSGHSKKRWLGGSLLIDAQNPSWYSNFPRSIGHISHIYIYTHHNIVYIYIYTYTFSHNVSTILSHLKRQPQSSQGPPGSPCELPPEVQEIRVWF